jgi:pimeloyl-ACP methyl ester carboxylesterase
MAELLLPSGLTVHYQSMGDGAKKVVFLHGLVVDNLSSFYFTLANPFAQKAEALLVDLRGHGKSMRPVSGYTLDDFVDDLHELLQAKFGNQSVTLVGNSFGGTLASAYALSYPERIEGLILIDSLPPMAGWSERMTLPFRTMNLQEAEQVITHLYRNWHGVAASRKRDRLQKNGDAIVNGTTLINDLLDSRCWLPNSLKSLHCPVLSIYGENSDLVVEGRALQGFWLDHQLEVIQGCSHAVMFEAGDELKELCLGWFDLHVLAEPLVQVLYA